jgi:hypothetical protein
MAIVGFPGRVTSYDLAVGVKISMDEAIFMISPIDSPFLNGIGTDGRQLLGSSSVDQTSWKWMDEQLLLPRANISAGNAALGVAHTTITVAAADSYKFQENDLVTTLDRSAAATGTVLLVSNVNNTTGVLTVGEWVNHAGQLATAHGANADTVICVGSALVAVTRRFSARPRLT